MPIPLIIPIATGIASLIGSIASQRAQAKTARRNTDLTIQANKKQSMFAYEQEQKNIEALKLYNSPQAQMKRFEDAGLNKNLIYTRGESGNQSTIAKYNAPNIQYNYLPKTDIGKNITAGINGFQTAQSIRNLVSDGKIKEANATLQGAMAKYADWVAGKKASITTSQANILLGQSLFSQEEWRRFFTKTNGNVEGGDEWVLKSGMEETFINSLVAKWLTPQTNLEKTQAQIQQIKQSTKNLSVMENTLKFVPWLQPFISFLKLLK